MISKFTSLEEIVFAKPDPYYSPQKQKLSNNLGIFTLGNVKTIKQTHEDSKDTKKRVSQETFTSGERNPNPLCESCLPLD